MSNAPSPFLTAVRRLFQTEEKTNNLGLLIWFRRIMENQEIRAALDRHWKATVALDIDKAHEIYHDDVIGEFPHSGERISGERNLYELRAHYPAKLTFKILRVLGEGKSLSH